MNDKDNLFGYQVRLYQLNEEDGGGWAAEVPELPGCFSDGETPEEALVNVRDAILGWMEIAKEDGKTIPPPGESIDLQYSGKFTVRVPKTLHKKLVEKANEENISLNQLVNFLLSYNLGYLNREMVIDNHKEQAAGFDDEICVEQWRISFKKNEARKNLQFEDILKILKYNTPREMNLIQGELYNDRERK